MQLAVAVTAVLLITAFAFSQTCAIRSGPYGNLSVNCSWLSSTRIR